MRKIPPFFITQTLVGFTGEDLNRVFLNMPNGETFILCEMHEPRNDTDTKRWQELMATLSRVFNDGERK